MMNRQFSTRAKYLHLLKPHFSNSAPKWNGRPKKTSLEYDRPAIKNNVSFAGRSVVSVLPAPPPFLSHAYSSYAHSYQIDQSILLKGRSNIDILLFCNKNEECKINTSACCTSFPFSILSFLLVKLQLWHIPFPVCFPEINLTLHINP